MVREPLVEVSVVIAAPTEAVWHALVDPDTRAMWWSHLDLDARVNGRLSERWSGANGEARLTTGRVEALDPARLLRFTWADDDWPEPTTVTIELARIPRGTRLHVHETGWDRIPDAPNLAAAHRDGWGAHTEHLRRFTEAAAGPR
ncbi:SRPBCC domain-containing protein [Embleya sp. NBC_00896]|uniref:SRPBCC family protein n=1 Tax=Embleya sp. NBC_00896 TaxID=2975961 RepID=UPI003865139C|nr:SRPBCC domain-containing protein [Embleya sp. NBC_00896]